MPKVIVGFIVYGDSTSKYLPFFLESLKTQTFTDWVALAVDNTEEAENKNASLLADEYPEIKVDRPGGNVGFAAAYNTLIAKARELGAEYFLALNPDITIEPGAIAKLVEVMDSDGLLGSVSPKILRWDFTNNIKTKFIDTCGIRLLPGLRFVDAGQGESDRGQFDAIDIIGPSGAAAMYRMSALEQVAESGKYFDELMFMYKEDCDLAYRLKLAGFKTCVVPQALVYHDRTAAAAGLNNVEIAANRKNKSRKVKEWSFLHQQIIFIKFWSTLGLKDKFAVIWYQIRMVGYAILFERNLFRQFIELKKINNRIIRYKQKH